MIVRHRYFSVPHLIMKGDLSLYEKTKTHLFDLNRRDGGDL